MNWHDVLLWAVLPYVMVVVLVGGTIWRYRYDKFGWTTRSSELHESRLLRIGSPLFHFGLLVVIIGHVIGLIIPKSWTDAAGLSQQAYHVQALLLGGIAGVCTLAGVAILIYRRRTTGPVFMATTRNDKLMYVVLVAAIVAGLATTLLGAAGGEEHNYRLTVAPWFRSLFVLQPDIASDGRGRAGVPAAHPDRHAAVHDLAVHPAGPRVHRAAGLPVPALHRLPIATGRTGRAPDAPRLGTDLMILPWKRTNPCRRPLERWPVSSWRRPGQRPAGAPPAPAAVRSRRGPANLRRRGSTSTRRRCKAGPGPTRSTR